MRRLLHTGSPLHSCATAPCCASGIKPESYDVLGIGADEILTTSPSRKRYKKHYDRSSGCCLRGCWVAWGRNGCWCGWGICRTLDCYSHSVEGGIGLLPVPAVTTSSSVSLKKMRAYGTGWTDNRLAKARAQIESNPLFMTFPPMRLQLAKICPSQSTVPDMG
jgi:hypothetical protein